MPGFDHDTFRSLSSSIWSRSSSLYVSAAATWAARTLGSWCARSLVNRLCGTCTHARRALERLWHAIAGYADKAGDTLLMMQWQWQHRK